MNEMPQNIDDAPDKDEAPQQNSGDMGGSTLSEAVKAMGETPTTSKLLSKAIHQTTRQPLTSDALQVIEKSKDKEKEDIAVEDAQPIAKDKVKDSTALFEFPQRMRNLRACSTSSQQQGNKG